MFEYMTAQEAAGSVFKKIGELSTQDTTAVKQSLDTLFLLTLHGQRK